MAIATTEELKPLRFEKRIDRVGRVKQDLADRLKETRALFGEPVLAVDLYGHSKFSDGAGTVEENHERFRHSGLDFLFITDPNSIGQKRGARGGGAGRSESASNPAITGLRARRRTPGAPFLRRSTSTRQVDLE